MLSRSAIGVRTTPLDISHRIEVANVSGNSEFGGILSQNYDATTGVFVPDRNVYPTILRFAVVYIDKNSGESTEHTVDWTDTTNNSIRWFVNGAEISSTSLSAEYYINSQKQLVVRHNVQPSEGNILIQATGQFKDTIGRTNDVKADTQLTMLAGNGASLSLKRTTGDGSYATDITVINVSRLMSYDANSVAFPWRVDRPSEWRRKCAVQLFNGATELPDAWSNAHADVPSGTAFYFWYYLNAMGEAVALNESTAPQWCVGKWYQDGSMNKELTVDMRYADDVTVLCRAGFVPYGEYVDYLDTNGKIDTTTMWQQFGYREMRYHLWVSMPKVQQVDMAAMSHSQLDRTLVGSKVVRVVRRALVHADGKSVIDTTKRTEAATAGKSVLERFFNVQWYTQKGNASKVAIAGATGEWLNKTPFDLGATNADNMPSIVVDVNPKTKAQLLSTADRTVAPGITVTTSPVDGDVLCLDDRNEKVWLRGGDALTGFSLPAGWTIVGCGFGRHGNEIRVLHKSSPEYVFVDVVQYAWTDIILDGTSHSKTMRMNITNPTGSSTAERDIVTFGYTATTLAQAAAAAQSAIEAIAQTAGYKDLWHAYADEENGRVIIQCDTAQSNQQMNQYSGVVLVTYDDMPYCSTSGIVNRKNGGTAVANASRYMSYISASGKSPTANVAVMDPSEACVKKEDFNTSPYCAALRTAYGTGDEGYLAYIAAEFLAKHSWEQPSETGLAIGQRGDVIASRYALAKAPIKGGGEKYKYPGMKACYDISYGVDGLDFGDWHMEDLCDIIDIMNDDAYDAVSSSLQKTGYTLPSTSTSRRSCILADARNAWVYYGSRGSFANNSIGLAYPVEAVTLLKI